MRTTAKKAPATKRKFELAKDNVMAFIATRNAEKARKFYEETLGLRFISDEPYALVFDLNGVMLRIQKVPELTPAQYTSLGWSVRDIRSAVETLTARGVRFEHYPGMGQDASGIWKSPSGARVAWFSDSDGNILSLTQFS